MESKLRGLGRWTAINAAAAMALLLALGDLSLVMINRDTRQTIDRDRQYIEQTAQLNRINESLVQKIAQVAVAENDGKLRDMLASRGIGLEIARPPGAAPATVASAGMVAPSPDAAAQPVAADKTAAQTFSTTAAPAAAEQRFVIRFDDRVAALTQSSIRTLDAAAAAARAGIPLKIDIEGCPMGTDDSTSLCARRLASLAQLLAQRGVANPRRLFLGGR